jgi:hypothetical protein
VKFAHNLSNNQINHIRGVAFFCHSHHVLNTFVVETPSFDTEYGSRTPHLLSYVTRPCPRIGLSLCNHKQHTHPLHNLSLVFCFPSSSFRSVARLFANFLVQLYQNARSLSITSTLFRLFTKLEVRPLNASTFA